ncbi:MAG: hypothetical protein ACREDK_02680 [Thermoplasmata archaeon]
MATDGSRDLAQRVAELERTVEELREHVRRLELNLAVRGEHVHDRAVVQRHVVYDWQ